MANTYNIDQVKKFFEERDLSLLSTKYVNYRTKLDFICNVHKDKGIQKVALDKFLGRNQGCKYCALEKRKKLDRLSAEDIIKQANRRNVNFIKSHYGIPGKQRVQIEFICPKHLQKGSQLMTWDNFKKEATGCPYCNGKVDNIEDFNQKLQKVDENYEAIGEYTCSKGYLDIRCKKHDVIFNAQAVSLLCGKTICPTCKRERIENNKVFLSTEDFKRRLKENYPQLEVVGEVISSTEKVELYCKEHDCHFFASPNGYLYKHKVECCPKFSHKKSPEQFRKEIENLIGFIIPLEDYKGNEEKIKFKCLKHNYVWEATPSNVTTIKHCPKCNNTLHNEKKIDSILTQWGYHFIKQKRFSDCIDKRSLPFDFYLPDFNVLIEFDGEFHYMPVRKGNMTNEEAIEHMKRTQKHDQIKTQYCKDNNIPLIRIPYWEKDDMEYFLFDELKKYKAII